MLWFILSKDHSGAEEEETAAGQRWKQGGQLRGYYFRKSLTLCFLSTTTLLASYCIPGTELSAGRWVRGEERMVVNKAS